MANFNHRGRVRGMYRSLGVSFLVLALFCPAVMAQPASSQQMSADEAAADAAMPTQMTGKTLIVGTKIAPPFVYRGQDGVLTGLSISLWEDVAQILGLKTKFVVRPISGLISGLANGSLDVAVSDLTVTVPREEKIDFSFPYYTTGLGIAVSRQTGSPVWATIRRLISVPFLCAFATLAGSLLLVGLLVWFFERRKNPEEFGGGLLQGLGAGFWWAAVTMTTVGYGDKAPRTPIGRFIGLVWMFVAVVTISSTTAAIATSLTVGYMSNPIRSVQDLSHARVVTVAPSLAAEALRDRGIAFNAEPNLSRALQAVADGQADAVVYDAPLLKYRVAHGFNQSLTVLSQTFDRQDYAFGLPPNSPLREPINRAILTELNSNTWPSTVKRFIGAQ